MKRETSKVSKTTFGAVEPSSTGGTIKRVAGQVALAGFSGLVTGLAIHYASKPKTYIMDEKTARDIADTVNAFGTR